MITVTATTLPGVLSIAPLAFEDHRGEYVETYNEMLYKSHGVDIDFVQDDYSRSTKNVLRGLHGDAVTWKLVWCTFGKFYLVVANCDEESEYNGKWEAFVLSDRNHRQILIPPKHANGHLILSDEAIFSYKQSTYYDPKLQFTRTWDDKQLNIWWPTTNPTLSRRDQLGRYVTSS